MINKYEDIINLSRPISKHPKMSLYQRSAQFAPFSALTGNGVGKSNKNSNCCKTVNKN